MVSVGLDVTCARCGYNLRGLAADSRCPECGVGVGYSLDVSLRNTDDDDAYEHFDALVQALYARVAGETFKTEDGVRMVAAAAERPSAGEKLVAADVCRRLRAAAVQYHGDGAADVLAEAGLHTGEDVGRVVEALARAGLIACTECDGDWVAVGAIAKLGPGAPGPVLADDESGATEGEANPKTELLAKWAHRLGLSLVVVAFLFGLRFLPGLMSAGGSAQAWGVLVVLGYFIPGLVL